MLDIYDVNGKRTATVFDDEMLPGRHRIEWDGKTAKGSPAPSGVYFCRVKTGASSSVRKLILVK